MSEQRRRLSPDFKRDAVALVRQGRPMAEVARSLGVGESNIGYWVAADRKQRAEADPQVAAVDSAVAEDNKRFAASCSGVGGGTRNPETIAGLLGEGVPKSVWSWGESNCHAADFVVAGQQASCQFRVCFQVTDSVRQSPRMAYIPRSLATFRDFRMDALACPQVKSPRRRRLCGREGARPAGRSLLVIREADRGGVPHERFGRSRSSQRRAMDPTASIQAIVFRAED